MTREARNLCRKIESEIKQLQRGIASLTRRLLKGYTPGPR